MSFCLFGVAIMGLIAKSIQALSLGGIYSHLPLTSAKTKRKVLAIKAFGAFIFIVTMALVSVINVSAFAGPSCSNPAALLSAGDGVWKAINTNPRTDDQFVRVFKFTMKGGALQGEVVKQLRDEKITSVKISGNKVTIKFSDGWGNHVRDYECKDNNKELKGTASGPRPGGSYDHNATLTKQ